MPIERCFFDEYTTGCLYHPRRGCIHVSRAPSAKFIGSLTDIKNCLHAPALDIDYPVTITVLNENARRLEIIGPRPKGRYVNALLAAMVSNGLMKHEEADKCHAVPGRAYQRDPLPAFVLNVSTQLRPSSTVGHFHLYLQHEMTWEKYEDLLRALRGAEVIGEDFYAMCLQWRCSFLLKPEFTKSDLNVKFKAL